MARTEEQVRGAARVIGGAEAATNGRDQEAGSPTRQPYALRRLILPALLATLLLAVVLGGLYFADQAGYVSTDNAVITGTMVQLGAANAGQVRSVLVDVGESVERNQVLATMAGAGGQTISLRSSLDGVVLARYANAGDTIAAGRPVVSVLDPSDLWVQAQVDETLVGRVRPGQIADLTVDAVGSTLQGRVLTVGRASAASVAANAGSQSSAALRAKQVVPVKIGIDQPNSSLVYGGQAFVRIHTG